MIEKVEEQIEEILGMSYADPIRKTVGEAMSYYFAKNYGHLLPMQSNQFSCKFSPVGEFGLSNDEALDFEFLKGIVYSALIQGLGNEGPTEEAVKHFWDFLGRKLYTICMEKNNVD